MSTPLANYVVKIYVPGDGDRTEYHQTSDIVAVTKGIMKARGIRVKDYRTATYPGHWPLYHEWTCTLHVFVCSHEIG